MPRGVPKAGFRRFGSDALHRQGTPTSALFSEPRVYGSAIERNNPEQFAPETDEEIYEKLTERFEVLEDLVDTALSGEARALIVSGPAGLGKSYTIEQKLQEWDPEENNYSIQKGFIRETGLYKLLYAHRLPNQVLVFDDADSIFKSDISLNLLKGACDSSDRRRIGWRAETSMVDDETGEPLPTSFDFEGTIIFITNYDFLDMIARGSILAPHFEAMISRAHYINLGMRTRRDYIIRMRMVLALGMLQDRGFTQGQEAEIMGFIEENAEVMNELSLRMVLKIGNYVKTKPKTWMKTAKVTCTRQR